MTAIGYRSMSAMAACGSTPLTVPIGQSAILSLPRRRREIGKTGLPRLTYHALRHSHATALWASGIHPKIASERLGHSKIGITLDLYSHVMPGMQEDAVAKLDAALRAAKKPA